MIKSLSPSALMTYEDQPHTFYLTRLAEPRMKREPQGLPAGMGSAFDVFIKLLLGKDMNILPELFRRLLKDTWDNEKREKYQNMPLQQAFYEMSVEEHNRNEVMSPAVMLAHTYYNSKIRKSTLWNDFEKHIRYNLCNIPLFMKLDGVVDVDLKQHIAPIDWKVMGYGSSMSVPKLWHKLEIPPSPAVTIGVTKEVSMEQINAKWATQLCTYGWGIGIPVGESFISYIHALVFHELSGTWRIAEYRGWITKEFQARLVQRYKDCWIGVHQVHPSSQLPRDVAEWFASKETWF